MSITDELKYTFKNGSYLTRLIYLNLGVFVVVRVIYALLWLVSFDTSTPFIKEWLSLPAEFPQLITKPWSVMTYMFLHFDFLHILFNMLWLFWFGRIFLEYLDEKKLLSVYILGGLTGALFFMLSYNFLPIFSDVLPFAQLMGASAGVVAIVIASAVYAPNHTINLLFIGQIKIKYIALISVLLYVIQIQSSNPGGHLAHLGGAFWGYLYISRLQKGQDLAGWFERFIDSVKKSYKTRGSKLKVSHKKSSNKDYAYNAMKNQKEAQINQILDKIGKSGYDSLTKEEKAILFKMDRDKKRPN
ncbi:rhomboid family intramembrane serine protease [Prolixibacteraceae bacterium JC049]|nr:rhomboid family intramembrane serine protease [Prolixibacteraceae bacterium JC049]